MGSVPDLVTVVVSVAIAVAALYKYVAHRERQAAIRKTFSEVVDALSSPDAIHRRAGAIMLRRFFDEGTEQGGRGTPYAREALNVIAATLRDVETGSFQKLLADGLAYAPSLAGADLQKTNLQNAYLGARKRPGGSRRGLTALALADEEPASDRVDLRDADFFRADLTSASLRGALARKAVFYQARLTNTVLRNADLRGASFAGADLQRADFRDADLDGATFDGARLLGARFKGARNIPPQIATRLDHDETFPAAAGGEPEAGRRPRVFLSRPGAASMDTRERVRALVDRLRKHDLEVVQIERDDYAKTGAVAEVRRVMAGCDGAVVVAVQDLRIHSASWRPATPQAREITDQGLPSPWTSVEIGLATALGLPILLAIDEGLVPEMFDYSADEPRLYRVELPRDHASRGFRALFDNFCGDL